MRHQFVHEFEDDPSLGDFDLDLDAPADATIRFGLDDGDIWVAATRAGWLHLARICAEMGMHTGDAAHAVERAPKLTRGLPIRRFACSYWSRFPLHSRDRMAMRFF